MLKLHNRPASGVTLIELIVTIAIAGILAAIAMPNFYALIQRDRLTNQANSLIGALNLARSEAIKRATRVSLCRSKKPNAELNQISCDGTSWADGWIVFVDHAGQSGEFNPESGDALLQRYSEAEGEIKIVNLTDSSYNTTKYISFVGSGLTEPLPNSAAKATRGKWLLCDAQHKPSRLIEVGVGGRARVIDLTAPENADTGSYQSLKC